jgi:molecular chaperone DnaK
MNEASDKAEKEKVEKLNQADSLVFQTEKQLKEYGDKVPADKKGAIEKALADLKEAHKNKNFPGIDASMTALNSAWQVASQEMYQATQQQSAQQDQQSQPGGSGGGSSKNDPVTDVDFEEVK